MHFSGEWFQTQERNSQKRTKEEKKNIGKTANNCQRRRKKKKKLCEADISITPNIELSGKSFDSIAAGRW